MNQSLWNRILAFLKRKMWNRRWQRAVTCLAAVAVFATTYALVLPAITMTKAYPTLQAEETIAWSGDELAVKVTAASEPGEAGKTVVLTAEGEGADLSGLYVFDESGVCVIRDDAGRDIELHRSIREEEVKNAKGEKVNRIDYWFCLAAGEETSFTLQLIDEVDETRFAATVEAVKQSSEEAVGKATASDAGKSAAAQTGNKDAVAASASNATATGSNAAKDAAEANKLAAKDEEKILTEKSDEDSSFVEILDGAVINDLEPEEDEDEEQTEVIANLKLSAGIGEDYEGAVRDGMKNANKRGNAEVILKWKDVITRKAAGANLISYVNGATIAVFYDKDAEIPAGASLEVFEIEKGSDEYAAYLAQAEAAVANSEAADPSKAVTNARFFDITIVDADGAEVEPKSAVKVVITYDEVISASEDDDMNVVHFKEEETPEVLKPGKVEGGTEVGGLSFTTDSFSVYGFVQMGTISTTYLSADGSTYEVTIGYGADAGVPKNARLQVEEITKDSSEYDAYVERTADAINSEAGALNYIKLLDISIVDENGSDVVLAAPVDVQIRLLDKERAEENTQIVHFGDETEVLDPSVKGDKVNFFANSFSVYAVVEEGNTGDNARMTLEFYNGDTLLATMYVKNSDTAEELGKIIYDPGAGTIDAGLIFKGWTLTQNYTLDDANAAWDITQVRTWAESKSITENETQKLYAVLVKNYTVAYQDENQTTIGTDSILLLSSETSTAYTVNQAYSAPDDLHAFMGWNVKEGSSNIDGYDSGHLYQNGEGITISGSVIFSVNAPEGHWLVYDENGKGATYNAPRFIKSGDLTVEPSLTMERFGYTFGGWFDTKEHADAHGEDPTVTEGAFTFGGEIEDKTTIYASWIPNETANYTVIIWSENLDGTGYDFAGVETLKGNVGDTTSSCLSTAASGDAAFVTLSGTSPEGTSINITYNHDWTNDKGNTALKGFTFKNYETNNEDKINVDGTSVINVYYDRMEYTLKFYYARSSAGQGTNYNYIQVATINNGAATFNNGYSYDGNQTYYRNTNGQRAYYVNGAWRQSNNNYGTIIRNGTIYIREEAGSVQNYQVPYVNSRDETAEGHDGTGGSWRASGTAEPGSSYETAGTETRGNYTYYYRALTAKYGTFIGDRWPVYDWVDFEYWTNAQNTTYRQNSWAVMANSQAYQSQPAASRQGTIKGKITIMDEQILGDLTSTNGNYVYANYDTPGSTYEWTYHIYFENESGDGYTWYEDVTALSHDPGQYWETQQKPPAYPGMDNDNVSKELTTGNYNDRQINYYYDRLKYAITFMDGQYQDGNGITQQDRSTQVLKESNAILYGASVASYNEGETDYYTPQKGDESAYAGFDPTGYVFGGWYVDAACTIPYTFSTMPDGGIVVYAKWVQVQYRIFLHPMAGTDPTLDWGSDSQAMNFRISYGGELSVPEGRRDDYEFVGWYFTSNYAPSSLFNENYAFTEDEEHSQYYLDYDKTTVFTDPMDKWGNGATWNSDVQDAQGNPRNRFWITKKVDLYAKWRSILRGAKGIGIIYDPNGGTNAPSDIALYTDRSEATAGAASTAPAGTNKRFAYWVVQTWDPSANDGAGGYVDTETIVYPGNNFEVLKSLSKVEVSQWKASDADNAATLDVDPAEVFSGSQTITSTHDGYPLVSQATYTIQLRAEYVDPGNEEPTHITWYANNGTPDSIDSTVIRDGVETSDIMINEAVPIKPADTFTYEGHTFLGWARLEDGQDPATYATKDNLFLTYHADTNTFTVKENGADRTVTQVAADERQPYHDLYAVWEVKIYPVSIKKTVVNGVAGDADTPFKIDYAFDDTTLEGGSVNLKPADDAQVVYAEVPYGTVVTVSETGYTDFETTYAASRTTDPQGTDITPAVNVDHETTNDRAFKITGKTIITVTNTRKMQDVFFIKTLEESQIADDTGAVTTAVFTLTDTDGVNTYTASPEEDGTVTFTGVLFGTYTLSETTAPTGYEAIANHTVEVDENGFTIKLGETEIGKNEEEIYVIDDPKKTASITLVKVDEDGAQLANAEFDIYTYDPTSDLEDKYLDPVTQTGIGSKTIENLTVGTKYKLKETKSPDGYILLGDEFYFQIRLDGTVEITDASGTVITDFTNSMISLTGTTITVKNTPGKELPATGGPGTVPYTLSGLMLLIASALLYGFRMRRGERRFM